MSARDHRRCVSGGVHRFHQLGGWATPRRCKRARVVLLCPQLVNLAGEALGGASRVDKHDGGAVRHYLLVDRLLNVRPDRFLRAEELWGRIVETQLVINNCFADGGGLLRHREIAHVIDRDPDAQIPPLLRRRVNDGGARAQKIRDGL